MRPRLYQLRRIVMYRSLLILLAISLFACAPQPTFTATSEPTQTQAPSLQIPVPSDWGGKLTHSDGSFESILIHLEETNGTLNIEPKVKTYKFESIQRV